MTQLGLRLPARHAMARADFMVAPSNAVAMGMIEAWETWPRHKLVLSGPDSSGKTHLAHIWADAVRARLIAATDLDEATADQIATTPLVVEDVPDIATDAPHQRALFHVHNMMQEAGLPLLMTGAPPPNVWRLSLPDLQSRVDAAGHARIEAPDDALLAALMAKLFQDRHLVPRPNVIPYLLTRIERSCAAARTVVDALDAACLAQKKELTRQFAQSVLDNLPPSGE